MMSVKRAKRIISTIILNCLLLIIYIFGLGLTFILALIFNRKILKSPSENSDTYWEEAQRYEDDLNDLFFQS